MADVSDMFSVRCSCFALFSYHLFLNFRQV